MRNLFVLLLILGLASFATNNAVFAQDATATESTEQAAPAYEYHFIPFNFGIGILY